MCITNLNCYVNSVVIVGGADGWAADDVEQMWLVS